MSARETAPPRSREEIEAFIRTALDVPAHRTYGLECVSWAQGEATLAFHANEAALGPSGRAAMVALPEINTWPLVGPEVAV